MNFDLGERDSQRFRRHLPGALQRDAKAYAEKKNKKADVELQSAEAKFFRWARRSFTARNERDLVRPLANVLGYLQAEDDVDILSFPPAPKDTRSAAVEGPDSFKIMHAVAKGSPLTKYRAMFERDGSGPIERDRKTLFRHFFEGEDGKLKQAVLDALDALRAETLTVEQRAVLTDAPETLGRFSGARDSVRSSGSWPRSFTIRAAWQALRGALQEPDYWLSPQELQILAACCGCRVTVRAICQGPPNPWGDSTLEGLVAQQCPLEDPATVTALLEDSAHVLYTMPPPPAPPTRGHFERLLTRTEMEELRVRVARLEETAAGQDDGAAGADDGRHAASAEEGSEAEDEMLYSTERSSSSQSEDESSSSHSTSESEDSGDDDESGIVKDSQLQGPVTESVGHLGADAVAQPQEAEKAWQTRQSSLMLR